MTTKGVLRVTCLEREFETPFTLNFERFIIDLQRRGKELLAFQCTSATMLTLYIGDVGETYMQATKEIQNVVVAPWRLYLYHKRPNRLIEMGKQFLLPRLAEEYADVINLDDPIEIVDMDGMKTVGTAVVTGVTKKKVRWLDEHQLKNYFYPAGNVLDVVEQLQEMYEQKVTLNTTITVLQLTATSLIDGVQNQNPLGAIRAFFTK